MKDSFFALLEDWGASLRFFLRTLSTLFLGGGRAWRFRIPLVLDQIRRTGVMSVPIVLLVAGLTGMILVLQTAYQLARFGQVELVASLVGVSVTRELGPLMTAIIVAGRVGAAFTAELGTMNVNREILAAETMAVDPVDFLVVPRFLALGITLPCLTTLANIAAILFAMIAGYGMYDIPYDTFLRVARQWIQTKDILHGIVKSFFFGLLITHVSCYTAFSLKGGASSVGIATMKAVVAGIVGILATDVIFTAVLG